MSDEIDERVLAVIRERLRLRIKEDSMWGMHGSEGYVEVELVLEDPSTASWSDEAEVLSSVMIDGEMLGHIGGQE